MVQLVEVQRYRLEGHGFKSRWGHCNFSLTSTFWPHYGPGVETAPNRNEYRGYLLGVKTASADCIEILAASASWSPKDLSRPIRG